MARNGIGGVDGNNGWELVKMAPLGVVKLALLLNPSNIGSTVPLECPYKRDLGLLASGQLGWWSIDC